MFYFSYFEVKRTSIVSPLFLRCKSTVSPLSDWRTISVLLDGYWSYIKGRAKE